ncbi:MAG: hypothetical protein ACNS62_17245 [Candidatus Cyclobacteriaceae bacterium M3_2C_046]
MKAIYFILVFHMFHYQTNGQNGDFQAGSRSLGTGNSSVAITDAWSMFNNIAGISFLEKTTGIISYHKHNHANAFDRMAVGVGLPTSYGNLCINAFRFGDNVYNEHKIGIGYSHQIDFVSLGIQVNRLQYMIEGFGNKAVLALEMGGIIKINPQLFWGAHIFNLNQVKLTDDLEPVPTRLRTGFSYFPAKALIINLEIDKDLAYTPQVKGGFEYTIIQEFLMRGGVSTAPYVNYFGLGFKPRFMSIDYALMNHRQTGLSHQLSLSYIFEK